MTNTITLELTSRELINANDRYPHWAVKAAKVKALRAKARAAADGLPAVTGPVRVLTYMAFPDRRRRDPANWYETQKACVDGITDARVWLDDSSDFVVGPDPRVDPPTGKRGVYRLRIIWLPTKEGEL